MPTTFRPSVVPLEPRHIPVGLFAAADAAGSVSAYSADTWAVQYQVTPFADLTAPVRTAVVDITGDGSPEVVAAAAPGGAPVVKVYDGATGAELASFAVGDPADRSGASVAAAGKDADGVQLLAVGAVSGGVGTVKLIRGSDGSVVESFVPFAGFTGALNVAAADLTGDGTTDLVVGAGAGGASRVAVFNGTDRSTLFDTIAFEESFVGGVEVSVGDLTGDGRPEVVVAAGKGGGPRLTVYDPTTWQVRNNFFAFDPANRDGVRAAVYASSVGGAVALQAADGGTGVTAAFAAADMSSLTAPAVVGLPAGATVSSTAPSLAEPVSADGLAASLPDLASINWQTLASGVQIQDEVTGDGAEVTADSTITVYYAGYLTDGTEFDSARASSGPATFALSNLIAGWQDGLLGMKVGGVRRMSIPAALAYGGSAVGSIPANSDLVFEVKLVAVA